jgi:hypothetical protein
MPVPQALFDFISSERESLETRDGNLFGLSFGEVLRYRRYLDLILTRYINAGREFMENTRLIQSTTLPGTHAMTRELLELHEQGARLSDELHLQVESFYLFSKIMLDKLALAVEFYFGQAKGSSLASHHKLQVHLSGFAAQKNLTVPASFSQAVTKCQNRVSEYRDHGITHEKSPRTIRATMFSLDGSAIRMSLNRLYPTERDMQVESAPCDELMVELDNYLLEAAAFLKMNCGHKVLRREEPACGATDDAMSRDDRIQRERGSDGANPKAET